MSVDQQAAFEAAVAALAAVGLKARDDKGVDLVIDVNGVPMFIEVKTAATVTPELLSTRILQQTDAPPATGQAHLLVADRVVAAARQLLREHGWGWLDLRGHLHLSGPGVLVDTPVPAAPKVSRPTDMFTGKVALEVACATLLVPRRPASVRQIARELARSPSSVSAAINAFRDAQLVDPQGLPVLPDLFWETAGAWRPAETKVASIALLDDPSIAQALRTAWHEVPNGVGWALADTLAAAAYGAPAGVRAGYPPEFYVPDEATANRAVTLLGAPASDDVRGATIRVAPVPQVCTSRYPAPPSGPPWPLAHPLFVALDLAADPSRGREILDGWEPPESATRVW